jgi:5'-nucleotidase/UDP-sugar diphosphatase
MLTANLITGIPELRKHTILNAKGIRFGIIGLTTGRLHEVAHPKKVRSVEVRDVVKSVEEVLPEVRRQSDFVIIVGHIEESEEQRLAQSFPEIRLIVGGHNHRALGPLWLGQTMLVKTGSSGRNVGQVTLEFQGKTLSRIEGRLIPVQDVAADPQITKLIEPYATKVARKMATVIGEASADLTREDPGDPLDNLIADAFRENGKTDIAIHNRGGIRAPLPKGPITWGHIFEVLPFDNTMVTLRLTGSQLKTILASGRMAVSGIRVRWDISKPAGERLLSVTLTDGTPIHDTNRYSVTTNDFLHAGGDGFTEFAKAIDVNDTSTLLRDVLVDYIKSRRTISPVIDGRAEFLPIR